MSRLASCLSRLICLVAVVALSMSSRLWQEDGIVYGRIGDNVTLRCGSRNNRSVAGWRVNGSREFSSRLHDLELLSVSPSMIGNYTCHDQSGELLSSVLLKVGYVPGIPVITCRAADFHNFTCYWKPSMDTLLPSRYHTTYRLDNSNPEDCVQHHPNMCSVTRCKLYTPYHMNITEENPLGSRSRLLTFTLNTIIKPDPPETVSAEPIPFAPRRLRVTWMYPSTWPQEPHFELKFRLQYRPVPLQYWTVVETANLSDIITDAFAGVEHIVQVSARDFLDTGNWSEWSVEVRATPWTRDTPGASTEDVSEDISNETTTEEPEPTHDQSDGLEKIAILVSLGIFAFVVLALFLVIGALIWVRVGKTVKESGIKADFLAAIRLKALPKSQIL